jgi:cell division protein FtsA
MNNEKDIIVGLDIGTTKIACFIGQRGTGDKIKIIGFGKTESNGVVRGVVKNIYETADSIKNAVHMASEQAGINVDEVYVGIAGQHIKSQKNMSTIPIPADHNCIQPEDVNRLIQQQYSIMLNPGEDIIHVFPQDFIVDGEKLGPEIDPVGVAGRELKANFHIVTGNTMDLLSIHQSVKRAGLSIKGVVLEPIASSLAVLTETDKEAGVALVDIGGGTTDIAIFHEGVIRHTQVLPIAGNAITNDIKEECKILRSQAETLKTRFGSCLPQNVSENDIVSIPGDKRHQPREISMRTLATIIKGRTESIIEQINFEINKSGLANKILSGIVLTGGGAQLRHIKDLIEFDTGIDTSIELPNEHLDSDTDSEIINTMYATGIGLVIYGFNELDEQRRQEESSKRHDEPDDTDEKTEPYDKKEEMPHDEKKEEEMPSPFGDDDIEREEPQKPIIPEVDTKTRFGKDLGKKFMSAVDKYFTKVFSDNTTRKNGKDEI